MEGRCDKHPFDAAVDLCDRCGSERCNDCLVYSWGQRKPPYCLDCAVVAGGVRNNAAVRPALSRKERKILHAQRDAMLVARANGTGPKLAKPPVEVVWCAQEPPAEPLHESTDDAGYATAGYD